MDLITQGILGAAVGQAGFQNKLGKKAVLWGTLIGIIPDLDVLVGLSGDPLAEQLYHRGATHSLFFAPIMAPLLAAILCRLYDGTVKSKTFSSWFWLAFWTLITHPLLDFFTTYGTQLLWPFSAHRFSISGISVIDPVYSIPLLLVVLIGLWDKTRSFRQHITSATLLLTTAYLFYGVACNERALTRARDSLNDVEFKRLESYPTLLQIHVRRLVAHVKDQVWIAYTTTYPGANYPIRWEKYEVAPSEFCRPFLATPESKIYRWFCNGDYMMINSNNTLRMQDLRFGFRGQSQLGIWGLEALVSQDGTLKSMPHKFRIPITIGHGENAIHSSEIMRLIKASLGYEDRNLGIYN